MQSFEKIDEALSEVEEKNGRIMAILGAHGDVEVEGRWQPDGVVFLKALAISGLRMSRLPRVWDNPERREAGERSRSRARSTGSNVQSYLR